MFLLVGRHLRVVSYYQESIISYLYIQNERFFHFLKSSAIDLLTFTHAPSKLNLVVGILSSIKTYFTMYYIILVPNLLI